MGLPSAEGPLPAAHEPGTATSELSQELPSAQSVADGQTVEGKSERVPTALKGTKGMSSAQPKAVDMTMLLTVPAGIQDLAAGSSDAHAMLLKVC